MKIAFLFLTRDNHNHGELWEAFFRAQPREHYSIFCHPKYPERITQPFLQDNIIPERIETGYADISGVRAPLLLMKYAFANPENEYFILLSESCIPLYGFSQVHDMLAQSGKSFIYFFNDSANQETLTRWQSLTDHSFIKPELFAKQHTWMALRREIVEHLLTVDLTALFEKMYCPDEHYFINLLIKSGLPVDDLVENRMVTFVNWRDRVIETCARQDPAGGGEVFWKCVRPKTYERLTIGDIAEARHAGSLFLRKVSAACDCSRVESLWSNINFRLVIARYDEDISWSDGYPRIIYNKGKRIEGISESEQIMLPNVGRESHTYLTYIIDNYDNLPEYVMFCQGKIDDHIDAQGLDAYINSDYDFIAGRFCHLKEWDSATGRLNHHGPWLEMLHTGKLRPASLSYVEWFEKVLRVPLNEGTVYCPGAIFCVASKSIRRRHVGFYKKLRDYVSDHCNPEEGHYLERSWLYVFARKDAKVLNLSSQTARGAF